MMSNSIIAFLFLLISHSFAENLTTTNISHSPITPIQPTSIFSSTTTTKQQQQPQQGTTTTNGNVITAQYANTGKKNLPYNFLNMYLVNLEEKTTIAHL